MRILSLFSLAASLLIYCASSLAQEPQGLVELLTPIHSLQGKFVQTIIDNSGKTIQRSEGDMALQRPGRFRWEVRHPLPQLIIVNQTKIWIYDPDLQQVVIRPLAQAAGQTPAFLLTNMSSTLTQEFSMKTLPAPQDWQWFSLIPKTKDSMFSAIELGFKNQEIKEMRMKDNLGHSTVIEFQHLKKNVELSASLFTFSPPPHVDVINEIK